MQTVQIVFQQVGIMLLLILCGLAARKRNIVSMAATKEFCNLLLILIMPSMIIDSYNRKFDQGDFHKLLIGFGLSLFFHVFAIVASKCLVPKRRGGTATVEQMAIVYSNCGFMAFPILTAVLGPDGPFYGTAFVAVFNIALWTHGVQTLKPEELSVKKCILNPGLISVIIGIGLYVTQIPVPTVCRSTVHFLSSMNTPLSMIITGVFLADVKWKETLCDYRVYRASILRLLVLPAAFWGLMKLVSIQDWFGGSTQLPVAVLLCAACPAAAGTLLMAVRMNQDGAYSAKLLAISTITSIVTLPLIAYLATLL